MSKYVYLFELDSVRKTDEEIVKGQKALYNEIVSNGNVVVLTYNQLVDSRGFFSLFDNLDYYKNLIALFENGAIRISQFGEIRTISQYLLNSIEDDKQFIYSALPLKFCQKRLVALMKRSLIYSDLSEIYEYFEGKSRTETELRDLFIEVDDDKTKKPEERLHDTSLSISQMRAIIENLYWLLSTVLRVSAIHNIYIPPKDPKEYQDFRLHNYLEAVVHFENQEDALWNNAIDIIKSLACFGNDNRSVYLRELKQKYKNEQEADKKFYQYAEAIINLCYNYTCEMSICNISKHYNIDELHTDGEMPTFQSDFISRLSQDWNHGLDADERYLTTETNVFIEFSDMERIPDFGQAIRIRQYAGNHDIDCSEGVERYEHELNTQKKTQRNSVLIAALKKFAILASCIAIACGVELGIQALQAATDGVIKINAFSWFMLGTILFLVITETITTLISKKVKWFLSLSDAMSGISMVVKDAARMFRKDGATYQNEAVQLSDTKESYSKGQPIDYVKSRALRRYIQFVEKNKTEPVMAQSAVYPIANVKDGSVMRNLLRMEELFHQKYGLVYRSSWHTLLVDPISSGEGNFFPYERVLPSANDGVVMVTKHNDNFVLLKQFRHAIRREQYSFPRGFAEPDSTPQENAVRELQEEIGAVITKSPVQLGRIASDSGLTGGCAFVFMVEINEYRTSSGHEGIKEIIEVTETELDDMIRIGKIDDGFTLGAYCLYLHSIENGE